MRPLKQLLRHLFKSGGRKLQIQVQRRISFFNKCRQKDMIAVPGGKGFLACFRLFLQSDHGVRIPCRIDSRFLPKLPDHPCADTFIEVFSPQLIVPAARLYLQHAVKHLQKRHVKRTSAQVKYKNVALFFHVIQSVAKRGCSRLIQNSFYRQTGSSSCRHRFLPLDIIKISRYRYHCPPDILSQILRCITPDIFQNVRGQFRRSPGRAADPDHFSGSDLSLDLNGRVFRGQEQLGSGPVSYDPVSVVIHTDCRGRNRLPGKIQNHLRFSITVDCCLCCRCSKVNSNDTTHFSSSFHALIRAFRICPLYRIPLSYTCATCLSSSGSDVFLTSMTS